MITARCSVKTLRLSAKAMAPRIEEKNMKSCMGKLMRAEEDDAEDDEDGEPVQRLERKERGKM